MPREYMCQYGNCEETAITVTVTSKNHGTQRYCCTLHAAASLLKRAEMSIRGESIGLARSAVCELADQKHC